MGKLARLVLVTAALLATLTLGGCGLFHPFHGHTHHCDQRQH